MNIRKTISTSCHYCSEDCGSDTIVLEGHTYCCYGCATLDKVVEQINSGETEVNILYKPFDLPENFDQIVEYQDDSKYRVRISLPDIHCSSCIELLEDLPSIEDSILSSRVNFENRFCTLTIDKSYNLSRAAQLLEDIGYPPNLNLSHRQNEKAKLTNKTNLLKLTVAGFCFGNIMLFSMPEYFGLSLTEDPFFVTLFKSLSILLSIPVLFYSGRDYLVSAYKAITTGKAHLNIPIAIGMVTLFVWSLYEIFSGIGYGYLDSLAGLIFFLLIGKWFQHKVYDHVQFKRELNEFIPMLARAIQDDGSFIWKRISELKKGDRIQIKSNEIIPVNGILFEGEGVIDYSFITGESIPQSIDKNNEIYAGGRQKQGDIEITLSKNPDMESLWSTWFNEKKQEDKQNWTTKLSKYFTISIIAIAIISGTIWSFVDAQKALFVFSSVLIVACPCALALSGPFTFGNILRILSNNSLFIKDPKTIEELSHINHIVFDKTGTLTKNDAISVEFIGSSFTSNEQALVASLAHQSNHPLSQIISSKLTSWDKKKVNSFKEISGKGIEGEIEGQLIKLGSSEWLNIGDKVTYTSVYISIDNHVIGHFKIEVTYRTKLSNTLQKLGSLVNISVLSGDNDSERQRLQQIFPFHHLKFNLNPKQKALEINHIQKDYDVLMIGDGLNDYRAIQSGNVGMAITENLNGFYPGADAILLAESFSKIPDFLALARYSNYVLHISLVFALLYNVIGLSFAVLGLLTPIVAAILMPLSSISVVLLVTFLIRNQAKKLNLI